MRRYASLLTYAVPKLRLNLYYVVPYGIIVQRMYVIHSRDPLLTLFRGRRPPPPRQFCGLPLNSCGTAPIRPCSSSTALPSKVRSTSRVARMDRSREHIPCSPIVCDPRAPLACPRRLEVPALWLRPCPGLVRAAIVNFFSTVARSRRISPAPPPSRLAG